jgi:hypothetical protein
MKFQWEARKMKKVLRSKGKSYSEFLPSDEDGRPKLGRGLLVDRPQALSDVHPGDRVAPSGLPDLIASDPVLILRQTISVLDKVIRKPRNIRSFHVDAYADRCGVAAALWRLLSTEVLKTTTADDEGFKRLESIWKWRAHPYAEAEVNDADPAGDKNAELIRSPDAGKPSREDFNGRWHEALWRSDPEETAKRIWQHLKSVELKIDGKVRLGKKRLTKEESFGLAEARGRAISTSSNDPRAKKPDHKLVEWGQVERDIYFAHDIAEEIFNSLKAKDNAPFQAREFGESLYGHFKTLEDKTEQGTQERKQIWALHNDVRMFYQKLGRSQRLRTALQQHAARVEDGPFEKRGPRKGESLSEFEERVRLELAKVVPKNSQALCKALNARSENAQTGELIRLGKLVAHATDLMTEHLEGLDGDDKRLSSRMNYFATSEGQAEIKRNEAFTRVWRNAVSMSHRTCLAWASPNPSNPPSVPLGDRGVDTDLLGSKTVSVAAVNRREFSLDHYKACLGTIFGNRAHLVCGGTSRASIFLDDAKPSANKEALWAFIRLGGEIRNRTNHFSTKTRLARLLTGGAVVGTEGVGFESRNPDFGSRKSEQVSQVALKRFQALLDFDLNLRNQAILDELKLIEFASHVSPGDEREDLLGEICNSEQSPDLLAPSFMAVIKQLINLGQNTDVELGRYTEFFSDLSTEPDDLTRPGPNKFRIGLLRLLYRNGFRAWLSDALGDKVKLVEILADVTADKKLRTEKTLQGQGWVHAVADAVLAESAFSDVKDLDDLVQRLMSVSMSEERLNETYVPDPKKQKQSANDVEKFRQEVFANLFGRYLLNNGLTSLFEDRTPDPNPVEVHPKELQLEQYLEPQDWHSQFYAWLYLVPSDQVTLLRQQLRKTRALEGKQDQEADPALDATLNDMDKLMGLYTQVQGTGFDGKEHVERLGVGQQFYDDQTQFDEVYDDSYETHHLSFPGTRRGLRQVVRFGHLNVLSSVFKYHRVTRDEVEEFTKMESSDIKSLFSRKHVLREKIIEAAKSDSLTQPELSGLCNEYKRVATQAAIHNFKVAGARLTDFSRVHQLMMRIVGRLTDYTLLWERDMNYLFLGLLYRERLASDERLEIERTGDATVGLSVAGASEPEFVLWDDKMGFRKIDQLYSDAEDLLTADGWKTFKRYADQKETADQREVDRAKQQKSEGKSHHFPKISKGKKQIRNDFAHYNILGSRKKLNLCYNINAVRSLFSYDRKLKNAVTKSVRNIVQQEGLDVTWTLKDGKLRRPRVAPMVETHLTMLPSEDGKFPFHLPRASVRYTSMVKALFEFDHGGHRRLIGEEGDKKARGELAYPYEFRQNTDLTVPDDIWLLRYAKSASDIR